MRRQEVVGSVTQKLAHPLAGTYVGKGKLQEIKARHEDVAYDVVSVAEDGRREALLIVVRGRTEGR